MARKAAAGTGTIRKKTVTRKGKEYTYWEARFTTGYDPGPENRSSAALPEKRRKKYLRN